MLAFSGTGPGWVGLSASGDSFFLIDGNRENLIDELLFFVSDSIDVLRILSDEQSHLTDELFSAEVD